MPRNTTTTKFGGFVKYNLTAEDTRALVGMYDSLDVPRLMENIFSEVDTGLDFKLKAKTDDTSVQYMASFYDGRVDSESKGRMLTGWGSTPESAMLCLMYKHITIFDRSWDDPIPDSESSMFG